MHPTNERELLFRLTQHDEYAFTRLFRLYYTEVYNVAVKYTRSCMLAEEITNDVFLKIWLRRDHAQGIMNLRTYLFVITRHTVYKWMNQLNHCQKTVPIGNDDYISASGNPCDRLIQKEYYHLLQKAVKRLPNRQRQVFILIKNRGFSRKESADILHINTETVKFHLSQAMHSIRTFCHPYVEL